MATLTQADLNRLKTNIDAAGDWTEGDENTDAVPANGIPVKSISKVNAEAQAAFSTQLANQQNSFNTFLVNNGYEVPIIFASSILVDRASLTVDYLGVIYAPLVSEIPFTTTGSFDANQWYVVQGLTLDAARGAVGNIRKPLCEVILKNNIDFRGEGSVTFTRASTATYIDRYGVVRSASVDEARFEKEGFLNEAGSTNTQVYSEDISNAAWTKTGTTVNADVLSSPTGSVTADELVEDGSTGLHILQDSASYVSGQPYTYSVFIKRGSGARNVRLSFSNTAFPTNSSADFDLGSGVISLRGAGLFDAEITPSKVLNGYWRISITSVCNATASAGRTLFLLSGSSNSYAGDNSSSLIIWGSQEENSYFPTSYIPTVAAPVARASDFFVIDSLENIPFLSNGLSVVIDYNLLSYEEIPLNRYLWWADTTAGSAFARINTVGDLQNALGNSIRTAESGGGLDPTVKRLVSLGDGQGNISSFVNGNKLTNTNGGDASLDLTGNIALGSTTTPSFYASAHISRFSVYDFAFTDIEANLS